MMAGRGQEEEEEEEEDDDDDEQMCVRACRQGQVRSGQVRPRLAPMAARSGWIGWTSGWIARSYGEQAALLTLCARQAVVCLADC